ncbi:MAG: GTPase Era [Desulfatiglans sp.]|jgi:GTP-binding protein Era|nr:GTPase Era [Thermodesulfobacteriota bacterium]MEE4353458.1 GTPase Era [Desulfatiglans sp.]
MKFLSGFVAIVGPPNVGKSTLMNRVVGKKLAIVSPKPQTTRNRTIGVYHGEGFQIVLTDTPGIHEAKTPLHESMVRSARATFSEVDLLLLMIDVGQPYDPRISSIVEDLKGHKKPVILLINKIDTAPKAHLLPVIDHYKSEYPFDSIIPLSARNGDGVEILLSELKSRLRPGPEFFPKEITADQTERFLVSEIIRERVYLHLKEELPYSSAVTVENMEEKERNHVLHISARIHVESESQKGILIGKRGRMIKAIGQSSRTELERIFDRHIYLDLVVRVEPNWSKDTKALRRLGY